VKRRSTEAKVMDLALALVGSTTKANKPKRAAKKRAPLATLTGGIKTEDGVLFYEAETPDKERVWVKALDQPFKHGGRRPEQCAVVMPVRGAVVELGTKPRKKRAIKPPAVPKPLYRVPKLPLPILGMDPSLTHSAAHFAKLHQVDMLFVTDKLSRASIKTDVDQFSHRLHRLNAMRSAFLFELDACTRAHGPGLLVVEGYGFASKFGKITERYEWGGQVRMSAYSMGWDVLEVPPSMLKLWLTGNGAASKPQMMDAVWERFRYKCTDDNDADAFALSQLGSAFIRWRLGATVTDDEESQFQRLEVWEAKHGR
jgi:Holliday junction resolvasome RuvABC endonuclease subunit